MDLATMMVNLANEITGPAWKLLWVVSALCGTAYFGHIVGKMMRASQFPGQRSLTLGEVGIVAIIAACMVNLSQLINVTWNSFGAGTVSYGPISYSGAASFGVFAAAINAVLTLVSISGGYFFFRGVLLWRRAAVAGDSSHGTDDVAWRASTHMIGGAALVQIADMIERLRSTLGLVW